MFNKRYQHAHATDQDDKEQHLADTPGRKNSCSGMGEEQTTAEQQEQIPPDHPPTDGMRMLRARTAAGHPPAPPEIDTDGDDEGDQQARHGTRAACNGRCPEQPGCTEQFQQWQHPAKRAGQWRGKNLLGSDPGNKGGPVAQLAEGRGE